MKKCFDELEGEYGLDNAQRTEQVQLDEVQQKEAKRLARLLNEDTVKCGNVIKLSERA